MRLKFLTLSTMPMPRLSGPDLHCRAVAQAAICTACLAAALRRRFLTALSHTHDAQAAARSASLHSVRVRALTLRTARSRLRICLRLWRLEIEDVDSLLANITTLQTAYAEHQNRMAVKVFRLKQWAKATLLDMYAGLEESEKWTDEFSANSERLMREVMAKKEWGQHRIIEKLALSLRESEHDKQLKMDKFGAAIRTLQLEKKEVRSTLIQANGRCKSLENEKLQLKQANELLAAKLKLAEVDNRVMHDALECVVCMQRAATTIFTPCGHRMCDKCADRFTACPHCRAKIQEKFPTKPKPARDRPSAVAEGRKYQIF
jgi:hypothetical protein